MDSDTVGGIMRLIIPAALLLVVLMTSFAEAVPRKTYNCTLDEVEGQQCVARIPCDAFEKYGGAWLLVARISVIGTSRLVGGQEYIKGPVGRMLDRKCGRS